MRRGDDRAFEVLYHRYQRRIHAYVFGMVKDHGRAEDVTQEVFVSALRRMRETEQPLAFKPWLYQIAKNGCIDAFRRSKRAEEVSYDADDGLAPADHSKLVGSGPSPDAAVAAKLDLDNLCGAFGGLSETHHEILVLRELEGLSYQEIGKRMGMSRPAVESTLFRARRRLTEEYDDIVSGARCLRIQQIIGVAVESPLGARDTRRLARHLAHCQSCRREALAAGLDRELFTRPSVRERVASRVAGLLPFPALAKFRRGGGVDATAAAPQPGRWSAHLPMLSDQLSSGWGKAAAGAAVLVVGVGGAAGVHHVSAPASPPAQERTVLVQPAKASSALKATPTAAPKARAATRDAGDSGGGSKSVRGQARQGRVAAADEIQDLGGRARRPPPTGPRRPAAARCRRAPGSNPEPASSSSDGGASKPKAEDAEPGDVEVRRRGHAAGRRQAGHRRPSTRPPARSTRPSNKTTDTVGGAVGGVGQAVDDTVAGVTGDGPVADTVDQVTDTVDDTVGTVTQTVDDTVGGLTGALGGGHGG